MISHKSTLKVNKEQKQKSVFCVCATFLGGAPLQVKLGTVLTAVAGSPLLLKQLVNALDDALQGFIHIQPNLLLKEHEEKFFFRAF